MSLTNYFLNTFVSQDLSDLTESNARDISGHFPQKDYWLLSYIANANFGGSDTREKMSFTYIFLRRAEAAFVEYDIVGYHFFIKKNIDKLTNLIFYLINCF